jgi:hypothetical protein
VNLGASDGKKVTVDGETYELKPKDALDIPMGSEIVTFESTDPAHPTRFYLASTPAHVRSEVKHISIDRAVAKDLGSTENANERTVYQYVVPAVCKSSQLLLGLTAMRHRQRLFTGQDSSSTALSLTKKTTAAFLRHPPPRIDPEMQKTSYRRRHSGNSGTPSSQKIRNFIVVFPVC